MRRGSYPGWSQMPKILDGANADIRANLWTLYWLVRALSQSTRHPLALVELGVSEGDSTRAMLAALMDMDNESLLWSVDTRPECRMLVLNKTGGLLGPNFLPDDGRTAPWFFVTGNSVSCGRFTSMAIDLVFVDTEHGFDLTQAEIAAWSPLIRPGGCMAFHDYWLVDPQRDKWGGTGVKLAVDEFANAHEEQWFLETHDRASAVDTGFAVLWRNA